MTVPSVPSAAVKKASFKGPPMQTRFSDRLVFEVALYMEGANDPLKEILTRYNVTVEEFKVFSKDSLFIKRLREYKNEIREKGLTFRAKARAQADELLTTSWLLIHDKDVPASVKADLIKSTVKWGGLDSTHETNQGGAGVSVTIIMGDTPTETKTINGVARSFPDDDGSLGR